MLLLNQERAGKKKAKAYASKTGKSVKMSNSKSTVRKKK